MIRGFRVVEWVRVGSFSGVVGAVIREEAGVGGQEAGLQGSVGRGRGGVRLRVGVLPVSGGGAVRLRDLAASKEEHILLTAGLICPNVNIMRKIDRLFSLE